MALAHLSGTINFKVAGQAAIAKWMQTALKDALDNAEAPPESLRFQCRIASDARENLALIKLGNGETLTLHPRARPQFGKNRDGNAFLTATMLYSGDGQSYTIRWAGDGVPQKMQEIAVKHDKGLAVKATTIRLDLAQAQVTPAWKAHGKSGPAAQRGYLVEMAAAEARRAAGATARKRAKRNCARLTDSDIAMHPGLTQAARP